MVCPRHFHECVGYVTAAGGALELSSAVRELLQVMLNFEFCLSGRAAVLCVAFNLWVTLNILPPTLFTALKALEGDTALFCIVAPVI